MAEKELGTDDPKDTRHHYPLWKGNTIDIPRQQITFERILEAVGKARIKGNFQCKGLFFIEEKPNITTEQLHEAIRANIQAHAGVSIRVCYGEAPGAWENRSPGRRMECLDAEGGEGSDHGEEP